MQSLVNKDFALFRRPGEKSYTSITCGKALDDFSPGDEKGFVIYPFIKSEKTPAVFIPATCVESGLVPSCNATSNGLHYCGQGDAFASYSKSFELFHSAVCKGDFEKLVLSRSIAVGPGEGGEFDAVGSFFNACVMYPEMMVMLFSTGQTGTWLVVSPEILVEGERKKCRTMALAGTLSSENQSDQWSDKNRHEQKIVSDYIVGKIRPLCRSMEVSGPYTVHAGELLHLRTDMEMELNDGEGLWSAAMELHPTPALCGLPCERAKEFILNGEAHADGRRYYGGFCGPVNIDGLTSLYVSIRCACFDGRKATLYAGGGIMPQSNCEAEFAETENKMHTVAKCIATRQI